MMAVRASPAPPMPPAHLALQALDFESRLHAQSEEGHREPALRPPVPAGGPVWFVLPPWRRFYEFVEVQRYIVVEVAKPIPEADHTVQEDIVQQETVHVPENIDGPQEEVVQVPKIIKHAQQEDVLVPRIDHSPREDEVAQAPKIIERVQQVGVHVPKIDHSPRDGVQAPKIIKHVQQEVVHVPEVPEIIKHVQQEVVQVPDAGEPGINSAQEEIVHVPMTQLQRQGEEVVQVPNIIQHEPRSELTPEQQALLETSISGDEPSCKQQ